jgi:hypothetical protein
VGRHLPILLESYENFRALCLLVRVAFVGACFRCRAARCSVCSGKRSRTSMAVESRVIDYRMRCPFPNHFIAFLF